MASAPSVADHISLLEQECTLSAEAAKLAEAEVAYDNAVKAQSQHASETERMLNDLKRKRAEEKAKLDQASFAACKKRDEAELARDKLTVLRPRVRAYDTLVNGDRAGWDQAIAAAERVDRRLTEDANRPGYGPMYRDALRSAAFRVEHETAASSEGA